MRSFLAPAAAVLLLVLPLCAAATRAIADPHPSADWMPSGPPAPPPAGYLDWCRRNPDTCGVAGLPLEPAQAEVTRRYWSAVFAAKGSGPAQSPRPKLLPATILGWTDATQRLLDGVNRHVNQAILEQDDQTTYGVADYWAIPSLTGRDHYGDCEDYVLMKRRDLIAAGVAPEALFISLVETREHTPHAVLLVATDRGEMVLDSLTPWIVGWRDAPYTWLQRQVPGDAFDWVKPAIAH